MDIKFNRRREICNLIIIVTILCSISTYGLSHSLAQSAHENRYYKIDDVEHVEDYTNLANSGIDKYYKLSESGLNNQKKQQLMSENSVITNNSSTFETAVREDYETIALTTDNSAYIGDIEVNYSSQRSTQAWVKILNVILSTLIFCTAIAFSRSNVKGIVSYMAGWGLIFHLFCICILSLIAPI